MCQDKILKVKCTVGHKLFIIQNIVFIKTNKKHVLITSSDNKCVEVFRSIKWFDQHLPKPQFYRCHNSYIINCRYVECFNFLHTMVKLKGFNEIPVSRLRKKQVVNCVGETITSKVGSELI